jgi:hypothetical protein
MIDEIFWINGFIFCFCYNNDEKEKENSTLVSLEFVVNEKEYEKKNNFNQVMQITIETNENPDPIFQSIQFCVKEFIEKNFFNRIYRDIKVRCFRNQNLLDGKLSFENQSNFKVNSKKSFHSDAKTASCAFCGLHLHLGEDISECENCYSKDFLIESKYALKNVFFIFFFISIYFIFYKI